VALGCKKTLPISHAAIIHPKKLSAYEGFPVIFPIEWVEQTHLSNETRIASEVDYYVDDCHRKPHVE
jgi:hypothetical protein